MKNWNGKLAELWELITQSPATFKGGEIWTVITAISNALVGIGYGLLVLFFAMGVFQSAASFREIQRPEFALRHFIRFAGAKVAVGYSLEIMLAIFHICGGVVSSVMSGMGRTVSTAATLPTEIVSAIEDVGFLASIPLWLVSMLGSLIVTVLSFILILTVYGRFFRLYMYTALAPVPLASFAGEGTAANGKSVPEILHWRVHGGGGRCSGLPDLLRVSLQQQSGSRRLPASRYHGVGIHRRNGVQHAGTHRAGQRRQPYYAGNVWAIESGIASQFGAHSGAEKERACARLSFTRCIRILLYCHSPHTPLGHTAAWPLPAGNGRNTAPPASSG